MPDKILIVDDEPPVRLLLRTALGKTYETAEADCGEEALRLARTGDFRLVLLDLMMPGMSGHEVCLKLRRNPLTCHMTVVMLTARDREEDVISGLAAGADDYIVKPFKLSELKARIESHLRRQWRELQANPLTGLPGNMQIEQVLRANLKGGLSFAVIYADLNNFKTFNDQYGFTAGDAVLGYTAELLTAVVAEEGDPDLDFVGHVGGDDFVVVTTPERAEAISQRIVERFDAEIDRYYSPEDRKRRGINARDRQGNELFVPLIGITLAVVCVQNGGYDHPAQISQTAAEVKSYLKLRGERGSLYLIDRRS
ncbi:MAG TPA: response regulator [Blastocatellia bacterium]|nr:response regulator [Blastocatellia bacterium]